MITDPALGGRFVAWFRNSAPYINAFRGRTFVVSFDGEVIADGQLPALAQDIALLTSLGIKLVLVYGTRLQIEQRLAERGERGRYSGAVRVTDDQALECARQAAGNARLEIEALLSMGLANTPMAGARIRVISGNFVTARPYGVRDGIDYRHTGEVRKIDADGVQRQLDLGAIVLLPPLGYSPTGELFNLTALDVAANAAIALKADKLICLVEARGLTDGRRRLLRQLTLEDAQRLLCGRRRPAAEVAEAVRHAVHACRLGVRRAHLVDRRSDGALLLELFTRDGIGTMVTTDLYEGIRRAEVRDIVGLLRLIDPLEQQGILVRRSRETLEMEIEDYSVVERDGMIIGCAALHRTAAEGIGELACLAVHPDYRNAGYGERLLEVIEKRAREVQLDRLFVLTTHAMHWFRERGFAPAGLESLPLKRRALYNLQRKSKLLVKELGKT